MLTHAITVFVVLLSASASAEEYAAKVVRVVDADSLRALHDGKELDIRLEGIDCPEHGQAFGHKPKQATSELAFGKTVIIRPTGADQHGRTLANVILPDGRNLNRELVRLGYARWFRRYSKDESLGCLEADARHARRGLWADAKPIAPWDWREAQQKPEVQPSDRTRDSRTVRRPDPNKNARRRSLTFDSMGRCEHLWRFR
jgi:micrococcal nuclease